MAAKGISGLGVAFMAAGGVIAWSGINNVRVVDALRALAKGQSMPKNVKEPFERVDVSFNLGESVFDVGARIATGGGNGVLLQLAEQVALSPAGRRNYCWGGGHTATPCNAKCFDCSGYVSCVLNRMGVLKGSKTTVGFQAWSGLTRVEWDQRMPGDILINSTHMGIMIDDKMMWNAACTACGPVKKSDYTRKRYSAYRLRAGGSTPARATGVIRGG